MAGFTGGGGIWEAGKLKLISQPEVGGSWLAMRSPHNLQVGSSVKFDLTPNNLEQALHAGVDSSTGAYGRLVALLQPDGHVYAQVYEDINKTWATIDLGTYSVGTTYSVEVTTGADGATLYFYPKGSARETGYIYRTGKSLGWTSFSTIFYTQRYPTLAGVTTAYVDNIEERSATISSNR